MKGIFYFCVSTIVLGLLVGCNCDSQPSGKSNAPYCAEVKNGNGRPCLYVNGKEMQPIVYGMSDIAAWRTWLPEPQKNIKFFAQEGVKIVLIDSELRHTWKQDGSVDISNIKKTSAAYSTFRPTPRLSCESTSTLHIGGRSKIATRS